MSDRRRVLAMLSKHHVRFDLPVRPPVPRWRYRHRASLLRAAACFTREFRRWENPFSDPVCGSLIFECMIEDCEGSVPFVRVRPVAPAAELPDEEYTYLSELLFWRAQGNMGRPYRVSGYSLHEFARDMRFRGLAGVRRWLWSYLPDFGAYGRDPITVRLVGALNNECNEGNYSRISRLFAPSRAVGFIGRRRKRLLMRRLVRLAHEEEGWSRWETLWFTARVLCGEKDAKTPDTLAIALARLRRAFRADGVRFMETQAAFDHLKVYLRRTSESREQDRLDRSVKHRVKAVRRKK